MSREDPTNSFRSAGWFSGFQRRAVLLWRLWRDRRVSFWLKLIPLAVLVYLLSPLDLLPDPFLGLGHLDDLGVAILLLRTFVSLAPREIVSEHQVDLGDRWRGVDPYPQPSSGVPNTIEGEYRVIIEE